MSCCFRKSDLYIYNREHWQTKITREQPLLAQTGMAARDRHEGCRYVHRRARATSGTTISQLTKCMFDLFEGINFRTTASETLTITYPLPGSNLGQHVQCVRIARVVDALASPTAQCASLSMIQRPHLPGIFRPLYLLPPPAF